MRKHKQEQSNKDTQIAHLARAHTHTHTHPRNTCGQEVTGGQTENCTVSVILIDRDDLASVCVCVCACVFVCTSAYFLV